MPIQKIKSGRIITVDAENYVGDKGIIFYDENTGILRLSDGSTPGGILITVAGTGSVNLSTVSQNILPAATNTYDLGSVSRQWKSLYISSSTIYIGGIPVSVSGTSLLLSGQPISSLGPQGPTGPSGAQGPIGPSGPQGQGTAISVSLVSQEGTYTNTVTNITGLRFDSDSGFDVTDLGAGNAKIQINSTFKYWNVDGNPGVIAEGLDTVNFIASTATSIKAETSASNKSITFSVKTATTASLGVVKPGAGLDILPDGSLNLQAFSFTDLSDVPTNYAGSANYIVTVNSASTGLNFTAPNAVLYNLDGGYPFSVYGGIENLDLGYV